MDRDETDMYASEDKLLDHIQGAVERGIFKAVIKDSFFLFLGCPVLMGHF
jgi:hypothetical protein